MEKSLQLHKDCSRRVESSQSLRTPESERSFMLTPVASGHRRLSNRSNQRIRQAVVEALESRQLLSANLVISEFLASNDHSITTAAGSHEDWIEIHNAGDAPANLNDYFLTDNAGDPEQWRFPVQSLA